MSLLWSWGQRTTKTGDLDFVKPDGWDMTPARTWKTGMQIDSFYRKGEAIRKQFKRTGTGVRLSVNCGSIFGLTKS